MKQFNCVDYQILKNGENEQIRIKPILNKKDAVMLQFRWTVNVEMQV